MSSFGDRVRQAREARGISQRQLAELLDLDHTYISKIENGKTDAPPSEDVLWSLWTQLKINCSHSRFVLEAGRIPEHLKENAITLLLREVVTE